MSKVKAALVLAAASVAAVGAALAGSTILGLAPWAHADDLGTELCQRLVTQNLWQVTHNLAWEHHLDLVPVVIPLAFRAVHEQCPQLAWRLPQPSAPAPQPRTYQPSRATQEPHDYYGDEMIPVGKEVI